MDDCTASYATHCEDCDAYFFDGEAGFDDEVCIECDSPNVHEVNA